MSDFIKDFFEVDTSEPTKKKVKNKVSGYAKPPGTGPKGETCGSCLNCCRVCGGTRKYLKCLVIKHRWTHGPGTDIRKKSPACSMWQHE